MVSVSDLKEADRPVAPKLDGLTQAQRAQGRQLAMIHMMHMRELAIVQEMIGRIEGDRSGAKALSDKVASLNMVTNLRRFGNLCGRECGLLMFHHNHEEEHVFPVVAAHNGGAFAALVAKLQEEHHIVHALIEELGQGAQALTTSPDDATYAALRDTFDRLHAVLKSHFHYEETELEDVLGVLNIL